MGLSLRVWFKKCVGIRLSYEQPSMRELLKRSYHTRVLQISKTYAKIHAFFIDNSAHKEYETMNETPSVHTPTEDLLPNTTNRPTILRTLLLQRWAAILGTLSLGILYLFISPKLTFSFFPIWLPLLLECVLILPFGYALVTRRRLSHRLLRGLGFALAGVATIALVISISLLLHNLPTTKGSDESIRLVRDAAILWLSNILVFGLWYWELDGGGPLKRHKVNYKAVDFLFPQQASGNIDGWTPLFVDYVFLAFNTATAFSPTDTAPLSRPAKVLMMVESLISLVVVAGLAARAINILGN